MGAARRRQAAERTAHGGDGVAGAMRRRVSDVWYSEKLRGEPSCTCLSRSVRSLSESWRIMDANPSVDAVFESQRGMSTGVETT